MQLDIFMVGIDGGVYTAGLTANAAWTAWSRIGAAVGMSGTYVSAVSRSLDLLDIFFVDTNGKVQSAAHDPSGPLWKGWWWINAGVTHPDSYVTAVSASQDTLALFVVGTGRLVHTAFWSGAAGWLGWVPVPNAFAMPGLPVWPVSRRPNQIDIVYTTINYTIETAACASAGGPPFGGPWMINEHWQLDDLR